MPTIDEIIYTKAGLWQLGILTALALIAWLTDNRRVLLLGGFGSFLGYLIPQSPVYENHRSTGAATLAAINHSANHLALWGFVGAGFATCLALLLRSQRSDAPEEQPGETTWPRRLSVSIILLLGVACWALAESTSARSTGPQQWRAADAVESLFWMSPLLGGISFCLVTTLFNHRNSTVARSVAAILLGLFGFLLWVALSHIWARAAFLFGS